MPTFGRREIVERPFLAFVVMLVAGTIFYLAFQFVFDGRVNVVEAGLFGVVFAAVTVTFSYVRHRWLS